MGQADAMNAFDRGAGSLCLDFVATLRDTSDQSVEMLSTPGDLAAWFELTGLPVAAGGLTVQDLHSAQALRAAVDAAARALIAGRQPDADDIRLINITGRHPTPVFFLSATGRAKIASAEPDTAATFSVIARDTINLLSGADLGRVRACSGCAALFFDRSPSGQRRWCSMRRCGEKAASANYRRRLAARA
ncbi:MULTISPECIES: ABATE domain-containing protein [unclassified Parafrankia]|uniref:CGNR zinc finger domain-containing protein n=1 Tax=unclassified Parafrankia TaxID=2994368 RepID=UPI000DA52853|nr:MULTISPECIES: CGNR zinc finger domain-containing protein [unclassified Parafrankia]TCJ31428.1 zf-CGNR multi-domain protein [Parafrankia sp. BMG5.11]SQD98088.1 Zn-ribbon-like motif-containing protein [Parafrankia sp. Ea1.12]